MLKDLSIKHLGQLVDLCIKASHYNQAQVYMNEMQERVSVATQDRDDKLLDEILEQPISKVPPPEPPPIVETPEPPRDEDGNVTRISTQVGDPGYDPDIHKNLELKIFCDGVHIPTAHTADTVTGTVWYYEKNAQGRIKTLTKCGKVEIRGLK